MELEINQNQIAANTGIDLGGMTLMITPPIDEDYWLFRVKLFKDQSIVGFPKYTTIGIGFSQEEDWNTNLPYKCEAEQILSHIAHNKKYDEITSEQCLEAIKLIQIAAEQHMKAK